MCVSFIAPKKSIQIIYASETVQLQKPTGLMRIIIEVLICNKSETDIQEFWCIDPQKLFDENGIIPKKLTYQETTSTIYNEIKMLSDDQHLYQLNDENDELTLTLPDPNQTECDINVMLQTELEFPPILVSYISNPLAGGKSDETKPIYPPGESRLSAPSLSGRGICLRSV